MLVFYCLLFINQFVSILAYWNSQLWNELLILNKIYIKFSKKNMNILKFCQNMHLKQALVTKTHLRF